MGPSAAALCEVEERYSLTTARAGGARLACRSKAGEDQQVQFETSLGVYTDLEDGDTFTGENTVPQESPSVDRLRIPGLGPGGVRPGTDDDGRRCSPTLGDANLGTSQFRGRWESTATFYQYVEFFDGGNERSQTHSFGFGNDQGRERFFHKNSVLRRTPYSCKAQSETSRILPASQSAGHSSRPAYGPTSYQEGFDVLCGWCVG